MQQASVYASRNDGGSIHPNSGLDFGQVIHRLCRVRLQSLKTYRESAPSRSICPDPSSKFRGKPEVVFAVHFSFIVASGVYGPKTYFSNSSRFVLGIRHRQTTSRGAQIVEIRCQNSQKEADEGRDSVDHDGQPGASQSFLSDSKIKTIFE